MGWSARHKWVSRSLARDEWIARTSETPVTPWRDNSPECCGFDVVLRCGTRDTAYVDVTVKRWEDFTGQKAQRQK